MHDVQCEKSWRRNMRILIVSDTHGNHRSYDKVLEQVSYGGKFSDSAVLYRMNAQSNAIENACKFNGIPYRIIGGTRFFDRAEVKDMLAYLVVLNNRADDLRLKRIINNPPRGLGAKTIETAERLAVLHWRKAPIN